MAELFDDFNFFNFCNEWLTIHKLVNDKTEDKCLLCFSADFWVRLSKRADNAEDDPEGGHTNLLGL